MLDANFVHIEEVQQRERDAIFDGTLLFVKSFYICIRRMWRLVKWLLPPPFAATSPFQQSIHEDSSLIAKKDKLK